MSPSTPRRQRLLRRRGVAACIAAVGVALSAPAAGAAAPAETVCPGGREGAGWTLSTTAFDPAFTRHPYVGNGYLSQRVPPAGQGYVATGEADGLAAVHAPLRRRVRRRALRRRPGPLTAARAAIAALPTWSTLSVGAGKETSTPRHPRGPHLQLPPELLMGCGVAPHRAHLDTADGRSTDLVYDVMAVRDRPHVGAVRLRMVPRWNGAATVTDAIDGAGARRIVQTGGGALRARTVDVAFRTTTGKDGTVASTLRAPPSSPSASRPPARAGPLGRPVGHLRCAQGRHTSS